MAIITTVGPHGPQTVQTFDQDAFEAWKAQRTAFRREQYADNPGIRATRAKTNAAAYAARKARKAATAETK